MRLTRAYWIGGLTALAGLTVAGVVIATKSGGGSSGGQGVKKPPPPPGGGGGTQQGPGVIKGVPTTTFQVNHRYNLVFNLADVDFTGNDAASLEKFLNDFYMPYAFSVVGFTLTDRDEVLADADYILFKDSSVPLGGIKAYDEGPTPNFLPLPPPGPGPKPPPHAPPQTVLMNEAHVSVNANQGDAVYLQLGSAWDLQTAPDLAVLQENFGASSRGDIVFNVVGAPGSQAKFTMVTGTGWYRRTADFYVHVCNPVDPFPCVPG